MPLLSDNKATHRFGLFCVASFLLSIAYGATFLVSLLVSTLGGTERDAGQVFAVAMVSTLAAVVGSGHLMQRIGMARCMALAAAFLVVASLGFALLSGLGNGLLACGLLLGIGWGLFYTIGPIMVAAMVEPSRRTHCFALLSGSMLSGIGSGPLAGKLASHWGLPVQTAFFCAAASAVLGGLYFWWLGRDFAESQRRSGNKVQLGLKSAVEVLRSRSSSSILMVGLGGAIFGGLGSFQTSYAASQGLDYSLFFVGFMGAAIACRLLIAGWVVKRNPLATSCALTTLMLIAVMGFGSWVHDSFSYGLTAALLGVGYGLNYSVINGLAANEAPPGLTAQALLLFSLAYFIGVFGFPFIAGKLISNGGVHGMLLGVVLIACLAWALSIGRWLARQFWKPETLPE
ncbi:MFS transporter [Pseudomonas mediterranea]|jgi:MFS family permease|uniref:Predicted arabinose efflux permease, MFS family n=1 Tax=Pseudomonas mediterranea TaxID=183795 RepID=A0AAX2DAV9_9PSED|nr:MFS transporter [Pseudomonas mediterranea]KGU87035.1 MFS transporter [Pseudomonas mediterranea CFBP 5447]MBL0845667.1 MFS transporter [Pseudomonas mediterranea]MDU9029913.1 MFS transporter [Pseudomonas mediterranea]QHA83682.1 MFS transporter [Pseudomonas mediterranea]UZD99475.1 MFS transporter [Pseudomonas mediterranea]